MQQAPSIKKATELAGETKNTDATKPASKKGFSTEVLTEVDSVKEAENFAILFAKQKEGPPTQSKSITIFKRQR